MSAEANYLGRPRTRGRRLVGGVSIAIATLFLLTNLPSALATPQSAHAGTGNSVHLPSWWAKQQALASAQTRPSAISNNTTVGPNIDVSLEPGPQSETTIAIDPKDPTKIVAGSNEIVRNPMRGYYTSDGGATWGAVDLPLPPPLTKTGVDFGSDPGVAWDLRGEVYYSYIVVFFTHNFTAVSGSEMAVAHSMDAGHTWTATYFALQSHANPFDDKPMIAVDTNPGSPFKNTVYVAWDLTGTDHEDGDAILVSHSTDHGLTFSSPVAASPAAGEKAKGVIGADPFVSGDGVLYVAYNNFVDSRIQLTWSSDGGHSFGSVQTIATDQIGFDIAVPSQNSRHALLYPACGASPRDPDHPDGHGYLYCSWIDGNLTKGVDVLFARSVDGGATWSSPLRVNDDPVTAVNDHFNQWLAVDPTTGRIHLSWYDTRLDSTRHSTNVFWAQSTNHGLTFQPNVRITTAPTNERTLGADHGNQYGDYEGIAAFGGVVHPIWTDRRTTVSFLGEEVFTATIDAD